MGQSTPYASRDRSRVHLEHEADVDFWSHQLGVSAETVRRTADRVGPYVADIAAHLHNAQFHGQGP